MKSQNNIIERWKIEGGKWDKLSEKHVNSKESNIKGYVTKEDHITGERLSFVEGFIYALEWVIDEDLDWWDKLI